MTDHESHLRDLLHAAVPDDASTLDPQKVSAAARRSRQRARLAGIGAAAVTLAIIGGVALVATSGADQDRTADDPTTTAPYDAPACPATLPELNDANFTVDDLDGLTSVRLCPDLAIPGVASTLSLDDQRSIRDGMDALIQGLDTFRSTITTGPEPDPARCAAISIMSTRQSLQFATGGRTVLVPASLCGTIEIEGHQIDGGELADAYLAALDQQRDDLTYSRSYTGPLTCNQVAIPSPARPGRERLTEAVRCSPDGADATPLDDDQLASLQSAWANAGTVEEKTCVSPEPATFLVVATDRGDVLRVTDADCGVVQLD